MSALSRIGPTLSRSSVLSYQTHRHVASVSSADPIQRVFVDKIREFKNSNKGLDQAHEKAMSEEMARLKRVFKVQDENKLAQLECKFPSETHVSLHDIDDSKELRAKIHSGEFTKQLAAAPKPISALLATIPDQTPQDLHLPPDNKPSFGEMYQPLSGVKPMQLAEPKPDYYIAEDKLTPQKLEEQLLVEFGPNMPTINDDKAPERDLVNYPRVDPPQLEPPTRYHIIPESWFRFLYPKTGVSGPYVFAGSFLTFLFSKEWLVMEHEMLTAFSTTIIFSGAVILYGPKLGPWLRNKLQDELNVWNRWQQGNVEALSQGQEHYKNELKKFDFIDQLYEIRKADIEIQLEAEHRSRFQRIYEDTKRRLDYLVSVAESKRQIAQRNMVNWVISNSVNSIGPKQEGEVLDHCIVSLRDLASKNAKAI